MDTYLWPLVSWGLYATIVSQKKKDFEEINKKNRKRNVYVRFAYNLCVCVCVCVCVWIVFVHCFVWSYMWLLICVYDGSCSAS